MKKLAVTLCLLVIVLFLGCGGKEYTYVEDHELKPGPGLFSGEDGSFTIYEGTTPGTKKEEEQKKNREEKNF